MTPAIALGCAVGWGTAALIGTAVGLIVVGCVALCAMILGARPSGSRDIVRRLAATTIAGGIGAVLVALVLIAEPPLLVMALVLACATLAVPVVPLVYAASRSECSGDPERERGE